MFNNFILIMEITVVYRCFLLLLLLCIVLNCRGCMMEEKDALLQIKASINSPEGTAFSSWYGEDCCQWEGVECDASTARIRRIFFHYQRDQSLLENWYPNATLFAQFKGLKELELPGNRIKGFTSLDELQKLKHLQKLNLHDNLIENASYLCWGKGALPSLYSLDLSKNRLLGHISECFCDSLTLTELILYDNHLQDNIFTWLSNMTSLKCLDLSDNQFSGSFPSFLVHNLTNIETLTISRNQFKGRVSFSIFANLSRLRQLDISDNAHLKLETESPIWFPSFNITVLNLAGCNLRNIPSFLSTQNQLEFLDLSDNLIIEKFPSWLMKNTISELRIGGNSVSGPFPKTFRNLSSQLTSLDISNNSFYGPLPEDINVIFPELLVLDASLNVFRGGIPPSFGRFKRFLLLKLSGNKLRGEIPYLLTSNMSSLEHLYLSNNNLGGDALLKNSSLPKLMVLDLGRNDFTGNFQDSLSRSFSQSFAFPQLRVLILRGNRLQGQIPQQLCRMRRLSVLDLSNNYLSGNIPECIDNITSWTAVDQRGAEMISYDLYLFTALDLSCNRLTGSIPLQITQLKAIIVLNMSHNLLTGQIPASLGNLEALEALDLSHNKLFGELSQELTALSFLLFFDVSLNNLSGAIPQGKQFDTFANDSYVGNPGLCGIPLERKCGAHTQKPSYVLSNTATTCSFLFHCIVFILVINFILFP
ncbi:Receptor like protein 1, putative [Theobroma cacao]|uniref:Receptor like protein 1, putative n=1 Tax=Theobroma cacao TaxID=3641 RepID=A0A061E2C1_THECC|nr:Receptor like protein 1, putative [Theobroma cacao]